LEYGNSNNRRIGNGGFDKLRITEMRRFPADGRKPEDYIGYENLCSLKFNSENIFITLFAFLRAFCAMGARQNFFSQF
jgi:hypothetical protein